LNFRGVGWKGNEIGGQIDFGGPRGLQHIFFTPPTANIYIWLVANSFFFSEKDFMLLMV